MYMIHVEHEDVTVLRDRLMRAEAELRTARHRIGVLESTVRTMRLMFRAWLSVQPTREVTISDTAALAVNLGDQVWWWRDVKERTTLFRLIDQAHAPRPGADPFIDGPLIEIPRP